MSDNDVAPAAFSEAGAPGENDEIEITPAMIAAGMAVLSRHNSEFDSDEWAVSAIFLAMSGACNSDHPGASREAAEDSFQRDVHNPIEEPQGRGIIEVEERGAGAAYGGDIANPGRDDLYKRAFVGIVGHDGIALRCDWDESRHCFMAER